MRWLCPPSGQTSDFWLHVRRAPLVAARGDFLEALGRFLSVSRAIGEKFRKSRVC